MLWEGAQGQEGGGVLHGRRLSASEGNPPPVDRFHFPAITYLFLILVSDGDQTEPSLRDRLNTRFPDLRNGDQEAHIGQARQDGCA